MPQPEERSPASAEELADALRDAGRAGRAVVPLGAGTRRHIGGPEPAGALILRTTKLDRIVEYSPADLTVTVEAGVPLDALRSALAEQRQWLPWDPPNAERATIGGLLATAASGPLRLGYGAPRDWTLGMRAVLGDGRIVKSGGKVVKNVAGYDLHKLQIGALGTLGVIAEITFKVFPLPERSRTLRFALPDRRAALALAERLRTPPLAPVSLAVLGGDDQEAERGAFTLTARYAGLPAAVERQARAALDAAAGLASAAAEPAEDEAETFWQGVAGFAAPAGDGTLLLRAGARPSLLETVLASLQSYAPPGARVPLLGYPGVGLAYARWRAAGDVAERLTTLRAAIEPQGGYAVVEEAPEALRASLDLWGTPPETLPLMRALKRQWDPAAILNASRYVGGL